MLRVLQRSSRMVAPAARNFSSEAGNNKLVITEVDDKTGYATVTLNRPPVNSLSLELLRAISQTLDDLQNNKSRGMILTSGHAPAGGCLLSLCCEYRVMCPNYTIGLNETQLGIVAPTWFQASLRNTISRRESELALTLGKMYTTDEALKVGMIDEIAENKEKALEQAVAFLNRFRKISPMARAMTKQALRSKDIVELEDNRSQDIDLFVYAVNQPAVQKGLEVYLESLKKKAQK
uniref:Uncharacterized protein n=1 Tax=Anopheles coluzzii TaxID=1518534 RepID=A0A8W7NYV5_ANOCL